MTLLQPQLSQKQQYSPSFRCGLKWRQGQLIATGIEETTAIMPLVSLEDEQWLVDCLRRSPVKLVRLDLALGEAQLVQWANASLQAEKAAYLWLPNACCLPRKRKPYQWYLKRLLDWLIAASLLLLLWPCMLGIFLLLRLQSDRPVLCQQWRVGARGKLFQMYSFNLSPNSQLKAAFPIVDYGLPKLASQPKPKVTALNRQLQRYHLNKLPQLLNVLRGEMSLTGPQPWTLDEAVQIPKELQQRLHALPGIIGTRQLRDSLHFVDFDTINRKELEYLQHWSLRRDLGLLLSIISQLFLPKPRTERTSIRLP